MSGDIGPGDVVICVDARQNPTIIKNQVLREGRYYRVAAVKSEVRPHSIYGEDGGGIWLVGHRSGSSDGSFATRRFRKLNDGEDNAELIAKIKSCSPVRQPVTAGKFPCPAEGGDLSPVVALNPSDDRSL